MVFSALVPEWINEQENENKSTVVALRQNGKQKSQ